MKNHVIEINKEKACPLAEERFIKTCGFDLENNTKHQRMMKMGLKVLEDGIDGINIKAVVSTFGPECFKGGSVNIEGNEIKCNFFEQIPGEKVLGVYLYVLTVGECYFSSEENIMDYLNADIWGTAFVDASIELLKEIIEEDMITRFGNGGTAVLSEEFGPGYFGMPVSETKTLFNVLDGSLIDVKVKDSGLMIPQKTCSGLYFVFCDDSIKSEPECVECQGNQKGCSFCRIHNELLK